MIAASNGVAHMAGISRRSASMNKTNEEQKQGETYHVSAVAQPQGGKWPGVTPKCAPCAPRERKRRANRQIHTLQSITLSPHPIVKNASGSPVERHMLHRPCSAASLQNDWGTTRKGKYTGHNRRRNTVPGVLSKYSI